MGFRIDYATQPRPEGLAQAFIIGEDFIGSSRVCLILGDNIFFGTGIEETLKKAANEESGASIFAYYVNDPELWCGGLNDKNEPVDLEEKPLKPKSHFAVPGYICTIATLSKLRNLLSLPPRRARDNRH